MYKRQEQDGARSLNTTKVETAGLRVNSKGKKTILCKEHYKEWKKESKDDRDLHKEYRRQRQMCIRDSYSALCKELFFFPLN